MAPVMKMCMMGECPGMGGGVFCHGGSEKCCGWGMGIIMQFQKYLEYIEASEVYSVFMANGL